VQILFVPEILLPKLFLSVLAFSGFIGKKNWDDISNIYIAYFETEAMALTAL